MELCIIHFSNNFLIIVRWPTLAVRKELSALLKSYTCSLFRWWDKMPPGVRLTCYIPPAGVIPRGLSSFPGIRYTINTLRQRRQKVEEGGEGEPGKGVG